jgi:DNA-binding MarR family transcriptional regulator
MPSRSSRLTDEELRAWQSLLHAHDQVVRALDAELRAEHSISFGGYDVLLRLARAEGESLPMTELAARVMVPPSTLTRKVDRLVADGYVTRERSPSDSRVILAGLTPAGRRLVRRAARTHLRGIRRHFTGRLSSRQLREVADALEVITGPHQPH